MAQIDFFMTDEDELEFVEFVFRETQIRFVPKLKYSSKEHIELTNIDEYIESREKRFRDYGRRIALWYFLVSEEFNFTGFDFSKIDWDDGRITYSVIQRNRGPYIDFDSHNYYEENGEKRIVPASISIYSNFWDPDEEVNVKAPQELRDVYNKLVKYVKKMSYKTTPVKTSIIWATKRAAELYEKGWVLEYTYPHIPVYPKRKII